MPKTIIKLPTWTCVCKYHQDFEPTQELMDLHFNSDIKFPHSNLVANQCPSCLVGSLEKETNPDKKVTITIMGEDELDTHKITDKVTKEKRLLDKLEKEEMKAKIQADILKFKALED